MLLTYYLVDQRSQLGQVQSSSFFWKFLS
ncbi:hypothetical protein BpHYR1_010478 [Brachionus plicatilis]|uniref:Uncharacterized protein n=1 Tax=Brachionus plicatilis TaxID=10195 RepID=A0A3M7PEQ7_BRAPC|nr:hypothetical protein BpHYR1_010478 [Brachionus plicatilis]